MAHKFMDIKEFVEQGFLHEANRLFFHPRGLALEVQVTADDDWALGRIWDSRDDPEGIVFSEIEPEKIASVDAELARHVDARLKLLGSVIQTENFPEAPA